jgi:hypothetical protein
MEEKKSLKEHLVSVAGMTEKEAESISKVSLEFVKARTPHVLHKDMESVFEGSTLGDSFRNRVSDLSDEIHDRTSSLANDLKEAINKTFGAGFD